MIRQSTITCPACGTAKVEIMPTDACVFFYDCLGCGALLRPEPGDCCAFCSYGSIPCPPIQEQRGWCREAAFVSESNPFVPPYPWPWRPRWAAIADLRPRRVRRRQAGEYDLSRSQDKDRLFARSPGTDVAAETRARP